MFRSLISFASKISNFRNFAFKKVNREPLKLNSINTHPKIGVVVHLYYEEQFDEICRFLENIPYPFQIFVSVSSTCRSIDKIKTTFPSADIRHYPNVGRDIAPFIQFLPDIQNLDVVCKIHTKKGDFRYLAWKHELLNCLLGSPELIGKIIDGFMADKSAVLAGPQSLYVDGHYNSSQTIDLVNALESIHPKKWGFIAGSMFWFQPSFYADFHERFPLHKFEDHEEKDGHLEHAIERLFGLKIAQYDKSLLLTQMGTNQTAKLRKFKASKAKASKNITATLDKLLKNSL